MARTFQFLRTATLRFVLVTVVLAISLGLLVPVAPPVQAGALPARHSAALVPAGPSSPAYVPHSAPGDPIFTDSGQMLGSLDSQGIAMGDLDGDGDLDAFVANAGASPYQPDPNEIWLNDGQGHFTNSGQTPDEGANAVALGDLDGDGDLDAFMLISGSSNDACRIWLNDGHGILSDSGQAFGAYIERAVVLGDVDGDGDIDAVTGDYLTSVNVWINDGHGVFSQGSSLAQSATTGLALGDMDGDGDLDLGIVAMGDPMMMVYSPVIYLNDGAGNFYQMAYQMTTSSGRGAAMADLNGDGLMDLYAANGNGECDQVILGSRSGWFMDGPPAPCNAGAKSVALGDVDGDGDVDAYIGNGDGNVSRANQVWLNDGQANWRDGGQMPGVAIGYTVALADVDGDSDLDALDANRSGQVNKVWLNDGGALLVDTGQLINYADDKRAVALGDLDGDGDLDAVLANHGPARVLWNDGGDSWPRLADSGQALGDADSRGVALGDLDGDGDLDAYIANYEGFDPPAPHSQVWLNDGQGHLTAGWQCPLDNQFDSFVALGDMDGDGDLDALVSSQFIDGSHIWWNDGQGNFSSGQRLGEGEGYAVALGDLDGDGDLDAFIANRVEVYPYFLPSQVWLNDGQGLFTPGQLVGPLDQSVSVALGDMDGDGDLDAVVGNLGGQAARVWWNDGSGGFPESTMLDTYNARGAALGDVDLDGDLDALLVTNDGQGSALWLNQGDQTFAEKWIGGGPTYKSNSVALGDLDGDGDLDALVGNTSGLGSWIYAGLAGGPYHAHVDATRPGSTPDANFYSSPSILAGTTIPLTYTLVTLAGGLPMGRVEAQYSMDGGDHWQPALAAAGTVTTNLSTRQAAISQQQIAPALPIGDMQTVTSSLSFTNTGDLEVYLTLQHPQSSQLSAALHADWPAPSGTTVTLFNGVGGDSTGFDGLDLGDRYGRSILDAGGEAISGTVTQELVFDAWFRPGVPSSFSFPLLVQGGPTALQDLDLAGLRGSFSDDFGGMVYSLESPAGTVVDVIQNICPMYFNVNLNLSLDDEAAGPINCDDIGSGATYTPSNPLSAFDGQDSNGTWTLRISSPWGMPGEVRLYAWGLRFTGAAQPISGPYRPAQPLDAFAGAPPGTNFTLIVTDSVSGGTGTLESWGLKSTGWDANRHGFTWDTFASGFFGQSDDVTLRFLAYPQNVPTGITETYAYTDAVSGPYQWPFGSTLTFPFRVRGTQVRVFSDTLPVAGALVYRLPAGQSWGEPIDQATGHIFRTNNQGYLQGRGELYPGDRLVALLAITATDAYTLCYTSAAPTLTGLVPYTVTTAGVQTLTISADHPLILLNLDVSLQWDARRDRQFLDQLALDLQRTSAFLYDWTDGQMALGNVNIYHDRVQWNDADIRIYATNQLRPNAAQGGIISTVITDTQHLTITYAPGMVHMGAVWNRYGDPGGSLNEDWPRTLAHELGHYALFLDDNYLGFDAQGRLIPVDGCPGVMTDPYREDWPYDEFHPQAGWLPACADTLSQRVFGRSDWATVELFYPALDGTLDNPGPSHLPLAVTALSFVEPITPPTTLEDPTFYLVDEGGGMLQPGSSARAALFHGDLLADLGSPTLDRVLARGARPGDRLCVLEPEASRLGCETIAANDNQLVLREQTDWQPEILLDPLDTRTMAVTVAGVPTGLNLAARLYPFNGAGLVTATLAWDGSGYTGVISATAPIPAGYVHVWVEEAEPRREALTDYSLGSNPGRLAGQMGAPSRGRSSPAVSADGQAILFGNLDFAQDEFYALQSLARLPNPLPWATPVGRAYRLLASPGAPDLTAASLSIAYMANDVVPGEEEWIRMYYWDGTAWHILPTTLDTTENMASAHCLGAGIYALMSSIEAPLQSGWNLLAYPVNETRPVTETLLSIAGSYTLVYGYDATVPADPWQVYGVNAPNWVDDLAAFNFGRGYWISATEAITLYLKGAGGGQAAGGVPNPPTTFYGTVGGSNYFTPTPGMTVTAWVDGHLCGSSVTLDVGGQVVYAVGARSDDEVAGCGAPGRTVIFRVGGQSMRPAAAWDNGRLWPLALWPNAAPIAGDDAATTPEDTPVLVPVLANDIDPDGDPVTLLGAGAPAHGTAVISGSAVLYTPASDYNGSDAFTYTAGDGLTDVTATVALTVTSVNDAPVAAADLYSTTQNTVLTVTAPGVLGNDSDVDGDPLVVTLGSPPLYGAVELHPDGSFIYTPLVGFFGMDSFTYLLSDDALTATAPVLIDIGGANVAPIAQDDTYTATGDTALVVAAPGVLANDLDPEGAPLTALLVTQPAHGTLAMNADGSFIYLPEVGFSGVITFTYRADDGMLLSEPALVTITVRPFTGWRVYLPVLYKTGGR